MHSFLGPVPALVAGEVPAAALAVAKSPRMLLAAQVLEAALVVGRDPRALVGREPAGQVVGSLAGELSCCESPVLYPSKQV